MFEITELESICIIEMHHGKVNAMDIEFCEKFVRVLTDLRLDSDCHAVILTSKCRVFSAGVDLVRMLAEDHDYVDRFLDSIQDCFQALFEFPKPMVAAIHGHAIAGGCVMAAACDYRFISHRSKVGVPELRVGVPFPPLALEIIRSVATPHALQSMVNVGATYRGESAIGVGLADFATVQETVLDAAIDMAKQLIAIPPKVFSLTKQQLRMPALENTRQAEKKFGEQIRSLWNSEEIRRMIQDFVDQRLLS